MTDEHGTTDMIQPPITQIRARLAAGRPNFAAAVEREALVERFCRDVSARLRDRRKLAGLDQAEVAVALQIGQSSISKLENGEGDIGVKTLFRYAHALGLELSTSLVPHDPAISAPRATAMTDAATLKAIEG